VFAQFCTTVFSVRLAANNVAPPKHNAKPAELGEEVKSSIDFFIGCANYASTKN